jgi:hypothetical protein
MKRALLLCLALVACGEDATEIVAIVDSDLAIPEDVRSLRIEITDPQGEVQVVNGDLESQGFPRWVGIVHEGGRLGPVTIRALAQNGGLVVVERTAQTDFQEGEIIVVRLDLLANCLGVGCGSGQTCGGGTCRNVELTPSEIEEWNGEPESRFTMRSPDAGPMRDAGPRVDAGPAPDAGPPRDAGSCTPRMEACNMRDDDCDTRVDETFDLMTDESNCGTCGTVCGGSRRNCCAGACERDPCM